MRNVALVFLLMCCGPRNGRLNINENPTQSPCFDGIMVNIENSCRNIHSHLVPGFDVIRVNCFDDANESGWASNTFYFVGNEAIFNKSGWIHVCSDPLLDAYFIDTHVATPTLKVERPK